jgi:hypothetical protein
MIMNDDEIDPKEFVSSPEHDEWEIKSLMANNEEAWASFVTYYEEHRNLIRFLISTQHQHEVGGLFQLVVQEFRANAIRGAYGATLADFCSAFAALCLERGRRFMEYTSQACRINLPALRAGNPDDWMQFEQHNSWRSTVIQLEHLSSHGNFVPSIQEHPEASVRAFSKSKDFRNCERPEDVATAYEKFARERLKVLKRN